MDTGNKHTLTEGQHREPSQCTDLDLNVTSEQLQAFKEHVGPLWWSVDHKNVRFSGLTDLVLNSNLPEEDAFWQWAEAQAQRPQAQHHVWVMHYAMFADDLHEPNWDITHPTDYLNWYFCIDNRGASDYLISSGLQGLILLFRGIFTAIMWLMPKGSASKLRPPPALVNGVIVGKIVMTPLVFLSILLMRMGLPQKWFRLKKNMG